MLGGFGSYDYNFFRWLGLEGEFVGVSGSLKVPQIPAQDLHVFTAMAGPKFYPFGHRKLTLFGHFLYGAGINTTAVPPFAGYGGNTNAGSRSVLGGWRGLDFNRWTHWGIRLIQFDYGTAKFLGNGVPGQGSKRISFGFVYRFGQK